MHPAPVCTLWWVGFFKRCKPILGDTKNQHTPKGEQRSFFYASGVQVAPAPPAPSDLLCSLRDPRARLCHRPLSWNQQQKGNSGIQQHTFFILFYPSSFNLFPSQSWFLSLFFSLFFLHLVSQTRGHHHSRLLFLPPPPYRSCVAFFLSLFRRNRPPPLFSPSSTRIALVPKHTTACAK